MSEDELHELKEAFDLFDKDQGGTIDGSELKAAVENLGFDQSNKMIAYLLNEMKDVEMDFHDFVIMMTAHAAEGSDEDIRKVFHLYDVEDSGAITVDDLHHIAKQLGEQKTDAELTEMITRVDTTGKGTVNFEDFLSILAKRRAADEDEY